MKTQVLDQLEIDQLKKYQLDTNTLINNLGLIEYKIQSLLLDKEELKKLILELKASEKNILSQLQNKYGEGEINLDKGEFISL